VTDNDPSFVNSTLQQLCQLLGVRHLRATVAHPQGNAPVESFHRTLRRGLGYFHLTAAELSFTEALDLVLLGYRASPHSTTGDTPAYLATGVDLGPFEDGVPSARDTRKEADRRAFITLLRFDMSLRSAVRDEILRRKMLDHPPNRSFRVGELVLLPASQSDLSRFSNLAGGAKLAPRWSLPHRVVQVKSANTALVKDLVTHKVREVHISKCRFVSPPCDDQQAAEWSQLLEKELEASPDVWSPEERHQVIDKFFERPSKRRARQEEVTGKKRRPDGSGLVGEKLKTHSTAANPIPALLEIVTSTANPTPVEVYTLSDSESDA
jgi:hypothetical protein